MSQTYAWTPNPLGWSFVPDPHEIKHCIFFVHGWRLDPAEAYSWADTTFKRFWQLGYRGRFAAFRWPTYSPINAPLPPVPALFGGTAEVWSKIYTYNDSEYRAWLSGAPLATWINQTPPGYTRHLLAHSMGNVVCGSAFRAGMAGIKNYAMLNAAMAAMAYDDAPGLITAPSRSTPDTSSDPATNALGLRNKFRGINANVINFYLPTDYALRQWDKNHSFLKPEFSKGYDYFPNAPTGSKPQHYFTEFNLNHSNYLPEIMAYVDASITEAAGRRGDTAGAVDDRYNMHGLFGEEHSVEWLWSMHKSGRVFYNLLRKFGFEELIPEISHYNGEQ